MKVIFTGAHFTPAQAVIEELKKFSGIQIVYVGRKYTQEGDPSISVESQVLPKLGVKFIPIIAGRLRRVWDFYTILSLLRIPIGFVQSFFILLKEKPDIIISFGGYVSVPVVLCGWILSIPIITHEQTLITGLADSIGRFFADKVAITFESEKPLDTYKFILTGNPIRKDLLNPNIALSKELTEFIKQAKNQKLPILYITGGNQGSDMVNKSVKSILEELTNKFFVIHQTGDSKQNFFEKLLEKKSSLLKKERYFVSKWFDSKDMSVIFKNVSLVISRAGINTLYELAYFGIPSLVIPLPFLFRNEQEINARFFSQKGLCRVLPQEKVNPDHILKAVYEMLKEIDSFIEKAKLAKELVIPDASKRIAQLVLTTSENYAKS